MAKTAANGSASMAGGEGIVQDAQDGRWQLDPSRNLDGTAVDGYESDEREIDEEQPTPGLFEAPRPIDTPAEQEPQESPAEEREEKPAPKPYQRSNKRN
jgi:hypothetical protein